MLDQPALPGFEAPRVPTVAEAGAARDAGMAQSERTAGAWAIDADAYLRRYLELHEFFHVDEFWTWAYAAGLDDGPSPRGFGAVVRRAARLGLMHKTRTHLNSARSHLAPKPVWRSELYSGIRRGTLRGVPVR